MKTTLWLTTFSMLAASPLGFSKTEEETLRSMVTERERQIRQLEEENMKLRSLNGETVKAPAAKPAPAPAKAAAPAKSNPAPAASGSSTYTVKAGDTLAKIGRKVGSSPDSLARLNGIKDPTKLQIGQRLKLPGSSVASTRNSSTPAAPAPVASSDTHMVRDGETFYSIGRKYKISAASLVSANPDINPSALRAGQLVRLKGKGTSTAVASNPPAPARKPVETASTKSTPAPAPAAKSSPEPSRQQASSPANTPASPAPAKSEPAKGSVKSVIIDGEMTYGEFATKHGTQVDRLNELNGLDLPQNTVLAKGSELYVYAQP